MPPVFVPPAPPSAEIPVPWIGCRVSPVVREGRVSPRAAWERTRQSASIISRRGAETRRAQSVQRPTRSTRSTRLIFHSGRDGLRPVRLLFHTETRRKGREGRAPSRPNVECRLSLVACRAGGRVSPRAARERTRQPPSIISRRGAETQSVQRPYPFYPFYTANFSFREGRASFFS